MGRRGPIGLLALATLSGCAAPVEVAPAPGSTTAACAAVASAWPTTVADADRVDTRPQDASVAAWGDPAIIARCGVPPLGPTTSECLRVDDVDWVAEPLEDGTRFTTYGREPAIEVLVPSHYAPEPLLLPPLGEAARRSPVTGTPCS